MEKYSYEQLLSIIAKLRSPEGCPWDRAQTHESMIPCLRDECEEVVEAINNKDDDNLFVVGYNRVLFGQDNGDIVIKKEEF